MTRVKSVLHRHHRGWPIKPTHPPRFPAFIHITLHFRKPLLKISNDSTLPNPTPFSLFHFPVAFSHPSSLSSFLVCVCSFWLAFSLSLSQSPACLKFRGFESGFTVFLGDQPFSIDFCDIFFSALSC